MNSKQKKTSLAGIGLEFRCAFSTIVGYAIGNVGLGVALGTAFGILFAPATTRKEKAT